MTIQPGAKLPIDMRGLLTSLGSDVVGTFSQGSVSVYFEGTIMPLMGQMTIENPTRHWVQQAEMVENDPGRSDIPAVLSGQWWGLAGGRNATIMVSNASANSVVADVFLAFGGEEHKLDRQVFNPNETKRTRTRHSTMAESRPFDAHQPARARSADGRSGFDGGFLPGGIYEPIAHAGGLLLGSHSTQWTAGINHRAGRERR